ncbi:MULTISPECIES: pyrimidine-nucleoside phosphorylase [unclassified Romboutsia]|uniref:pyrimidine-nucleoside phosphorylase n=1 Tax=unclassified Romboutsia TaxID=2626894 RepID=UPI00189A277C|nr:MULTISPECIES: pyrimidine-nucleoside phosphorylase [unclassified Romboutsia]MDB8804502.1 pyrimidine-nucleoside phosphorylase [Romboutsia sp. 1001216sp1]MDB8806574.1 pyrimidine-nucleoside phosphorylase [Romboutsia sp. 1001216sp1]MDB8810150.1 pyrimidine-nucleoside phosphorylase [Romboutsia sp. 1001216sp1]MDB8815897.1 pyrimidine-nucleoside phosphorylase [Romboutsia sp. 1001216sp1]MDB8818347.1 pyrimidine-nucleoside phosphorylase [Romboutsia sp. 1001216sp1]
MRIYDIIRKKRDGHELSKEEINFFVEKYSKNEIPDYQASALLMAIYINKMNKQETVYLTEAMMNSGDVIDLSAIKGIKVDKHSTGGVGDKTTIALAPLVASCGAPVAKMSGRGLGHTGGTLDKLEAIPGFSIEMDAEKFINSVNEKNIAVCGQTATIAVADKKMYALRDVTATVDNISLIAASIMCKKLASGSNAILLDVKTGDGAFMKTLDDSFELAKAMVDIGCGMGRETIGMITNMDEPLGFAVGNSLEVIEAIETLKGNGPKDFVMLCETLGAYMLVLAKVCESFEEGKKMIQDAISSGRALEKLKEFIENQGGDKRVVDDYDLLPKSKNIVPIKSPKSGYISKIEAEEIGVSAMILGAGRETKEDELDLSAGIVLQKKVGDYVNEGDVLAYMHYNKEEKFEQAKERFINAYEIVDDKTQPKKLIYGVVTKDEIKKF